MLELFLAFFRTYFEPLYQAYYGRPMDDDSHQAPVLNPNQQYDLSSIENIQNVHNIKAQFPNIIGMIKRTCTRLGGRQRDRK